MFGLGLGQSAASVSADLGGLIGENGEALQIAVTNAYVHPAADRFISGNNSVTGTALPTSVTIDGSRALYLDFRHDSQWFNRDTKYIQTNDGSDLFFLPIDAQPAGYTWTQTLSGSRSTIVGPTNIPAATPYLIWNTLYVSQPVFEGGNPVGFVEPTSAFTFHSSVSGATLYPVVYMFMYADCPQGADDADTTESGAPVVVDVLANDPTEELTLQSVTQPANGTVTENADGTVTYLPNPGFSGVDTFTYTAEDIFGQEVTQTVTITVTPVGADDEATTPSGTPVEIPVLDNDPTQGLTVESVTQPANGSVVINADGTVTYTPNAGFSGTDTFTYTAVDASGQEVTQTVTVTVRSQSQPPEQTPDPETPGSTETPGSPGTPDASPTSGTSPSGATSTTSPTTGGRDLAATGAQGLSVALTAAAAALGLGALALAARRRRTLG